MNRKIVGRILIFLGVGVWVPYLVLKIAGANVETLPFLAVHLSSVIPGSILVRGETLVRLVRRLLDRETNRPAM